MEISENSQKSNLRVNETGDSGGSESENIEDPVVGNLNKFAVIPPGYTGRVKKGHLIFDACFESGNLGRVDFINEFEYDLFIRPDTCNPRFRVWFNFTIENVKADQRVIFNIVNFSKTKSLYRDGMSPMVKSTSRPNWCRIPSKNVFYYRCPEHRKNYVMSFAFCFDREDDVYQISYCYPYTYGYLENYLNELEAKKLDYFKRELLGLSVQQRRLELLTITNPKNLDSNYNQRIIFITARVHPGETPSSYVCEGFMDFILSDQPMARMLRDLAIFKIVPMLNPDGVYLGNYRCSLMGFDLNRQWQDPSPWAHPTIEACKNLLMSMDRDSIVNIDFYIDIHAHSTMMNGFMYGNVYEDEARHERQALFPKLFQQNAEDFSLSNTNFNRDAIKAGTGRRTLGGCLQDKTLCYTLEVSFFSYLNCSNITVPYTQDSYCRLGQNLGKTLFDYYKYKDILPNPTMKSITNVIKDDNTSSQKNQSKSEKNNFISNSRSVPLRLSSKSSNQDLGQPISDLTSSLMSSKSK